MFYSTMYSSAVGDLMLASDGHQLSGLWMVGQKYYGSMLLEKITEKSDLPVFDQTKHWLDQYFAGKKPDASVLPLAPLGGLFRQNVWNILRSIPYGKLMTYGNIAKKIAMKTNQASMSAQAVGGAVGHNPIAIIIPCHRVVGSNGSLTGYAGGLSKKIKLLEHEGVDMRQLFVPAEKRSLFNKNE